MMTEEISLYYKGIKIVFDTNNDEWVALAGENVVGDSTLYFGA